MLLRIRPIQVKDYWEQIKFAAVKADMVSEGDMLEYCTNLLLDLLNDKVQCIISVGDDRKVNRILLITVMYNEVRKIKIFVLKCLYSFKPSDLNGWLEEFEMVKKYAKKMDCQCIDMTTPSPVVSKLAERVGLERVSSRYSISI